MKVAIKSRGFKALETQLRKFNARQESKKNIQGKKKEWVLSDNSSRMMTDNSFSGCHRILLQPQRVASLKREKRVSRPSL